ncbi:MAG: sugar transferase [Lentisphaerae bacterium]|nr:sugar transferase [Lentisphaerota bacterium]
MEITATEQTAHVHKLLPSMDEGLAQRARIASNGFYNRHGKRAFDLVAGTLLLIAFSPVIGVAWLCVRLTSTGPGFFAQPRVGLNGKLVTIYKLRSMYVDQAHLVDAEEIRRKEAAGILHKLENDPRVTAVGRFIRKTSIDELPQLWNVVLGDMSLVGPRPLLPSMLAPFPDISAVRNLVRPGVTGEWQVSARFDNTSATGMARHDLSYVQTVSFAKDIQLLFRTIAVVCKTKEAY